MPDRASLFWLSVFQGYHLVTLEHKNLQCMVNITIGRVPRFGKANPLEAHLMIGGPGFIQIKIRHKFKMKSRYSSCSSGRKIIKSQWRTIITCGLLALYVAVPISFPYHYIQYLRMQNSGALAVYSKRIRLFSKIAFSGHWEADFKD